MWAEFLPRNPDATTIVSAVLIRTGAVTALLQYECAFCAAYIRKNHRRFDHYGTREWLSSLTGILFAFPCQLEWGAIRCSIRPVTIA
jgi:hypothetical protein